MPFFMIEHPIILLNPNSPTCNVAEKVPNLHFLDKLLKNPLLKNGLSPMKGIMITSMDSTKIMHDESGPLPSSLGLECNPKFYVKPIRLCQEDKTHIDCKWLLEQFCNVSRNIDEYSNYMCQCVSIRRWELDNS